MKNLFLILVLGLALPTLAAERFTSDADHTFAFFEFNHLGYSVQRSRFDKLSATLELDRENRSGKIEATIAVASVSTGSAAFNQTLLGEGFFDAAKFPTISFTSTALAFDRFDGIASVTGDLTIKGTTLPVTLTLSNYRCMIHPLLRKEACGANASTTIRRSAFGLGKFAPLVGDTVTITIAIEALKAE
ncbi:MAG: YceI family protein [Pseudomonadota bacterium]